MKSEEKEQNTKLIETFENELGKVIRITLDENRAVEIEIHKDGRARVLLCIGSEAIGIDEEVKGEEYHLWATDTSGGVLSRNISCLERWYNFYLCRHFRRGH